MREVPWCAGLLVEKLSTASSLFVVAMDVFQERLASHTSNSLRFVVPTVTVRDGADPVGCCSECSLFAVPLVDIEAVMSELSGARAVMHGANRTT